ncbi:MAG: 3-deoxy-manno-octulosonate cytidylyltransferase [Sphingobacteriales bacterium]|nr:MAG: 3-deoxy-manno-octulosonate cytidylyltransferase [Sphingobacteriales bacterium]
MRNVALIAAHTSADVGPNILLQELDGVKLICHTYHSVQETGLFQDVFVVSANDEVIQAVKDCGGKAIKNKASHHTATDSIAEIAMDIDADVFVNIPGNLPFTSKNSLHKLISTFDSPYGNNIQVASIVQKFKTAGDAADVKHVKVAIDLRQNALFFSHSVIPYLKNPSFMINYYRHVPVYAYRKIELLNFALLPKSPLESAEQIECLRFIENGVPIRMIISQYPDITIRSTEDFALAADYKATVSA